MKLNIKQQNLIVILPKMNRFDDAFKFFVLDTLKEKKLFVLKMKEIWVRI